MEHILKLPSKLIVFFVLLWGPFIGREARAQNIYSGSIIDNYDGDTCHIMVEVGFDTFVKINVRIDGFNAPELNGSNKVLAQKAKDRLAALSRENPIVYIIDERKWSFDRRVAKVFIKDRATGELKDIAVIMKSEGYNVTQGQ